MSSRANATPAHGVCIAADEMPFLMHVLLVVCGLFGLVVARATAQQGEAVSSPPAQAPTPPTEQDLGRQQRLRRALAQVPALREVTATVVADVVTLGGRAPSAAAREDALRIAHKLDNVLYVLDDIELVVAPAAPSAAPQTPDSKDEQLERRLRSIFSQVPALDDVRVSVKAGVVHLSGETDAEPLRTEVEELARKQDGTAFVVNGITLTKDITDRISPSVDKLLTRFRDWLAGAPLLVVALLILAGFYFLSAMVSRVNPVYRRLTDNKLLQDVLRRAARVLVMLFGIFLALEVLDATALVGGVLGTAGVIGLALGFAFRDIVENYLASIILSVRRPFRGNDLVKIGEHLGTVIRLSASDTVLMTPDGNHLHIANATVFKSAIVNYTRNPLRRFDFVVGVSTDADLQVAQQLGVDILAQLAGVAHDPKPFARIEALGDSNVAVRYFAWVQQTVADYGKVQSEAIRLVKTALEAHDIELPVPIQRVQFERAPRAEPAVAAPAGAAPRLLRAHQAEAKRADVSIEDELTEQVERDRALSPDKDLLKDPPKADPPATAPSTVTGSPEPKT